MQMICTWLGTLFWLLGAMAFFSALEPRGLAFAIMAGISGSIFFAAAAIVRTLRSGRAQEK